MSFSANRRTQMEKLRVNTVASDRFWELAKSKVISSIRMVGEWEVVIYRGILTELYRHGVTRYQLPNLKALAYYMNADYR